LAYFYPNVRLQLTLDSNNLLSMSFFHIFQPINVLHDLLMFQYENHLTSSLDCIWLNGSQSVYCGLCLLVYRVEQLSLVDDCVVLIWISWLLCFDIIAQPYELIIGHLCMILTCIIIILWVLIYFSMKMQHGHCV